MKIKRKRTLINVMPMIQFNWYLVVYSRQLNRIVWIMFEVLCSCSAAFLAYALSYEWIDTFFATSLLSFSLAFISFNCSMTQVALIKNENLWLQLFISLFLSFPCNRHRNAARDLSGAISAINEYDRFQSQRVIAFFVRSSASCIRRVILVPRNDATIKSLLCRGKSTETKSVVSFVNDNDLYFPKIFLVAFFLQYLIFRRLRHKCIT